MSVKRIELLKKIAEQEKLMKKIAEDTDLNNAADAEDYSDKLFNKLLESVKINGLED